MRARKAERFSQNFRNISGTNLLRITIKAVSRRQSQILFDRIVTDGYINQRSILKSPNELVVLDRIDGDAAVASAKRAVVFRAKGSGGVPVRVQDPFKWRRVVNVAVVGGTPSSTTTIMFG